MENEKRKALELLIEQHKEEIALLQENHNIALSEVKKKQWVIYFTFLVQIIYNNELLIFDIMF